MDTWETAGGAMRRLLLFNCSVMSDSATPWAVAHQTPLSMGFPRQEYWSGLPFPYPGDLPNPGIEPMSPALAEGFFTAEPPGFLVRGLGGCKRQGEGWTIIRTKKWLQMK